MTSIQGAGSNDRSLNNNNNFQRLSLIAVNILDTYQWAVQKTLYSTVMIVNLTHSLQKPSKDSSLCDCGPAHCWYHVSPLNHPDTSPLQRNISTKKYMSVQSGKEEKYPSALPVVLGNLFFLEDLQHPAERGKDERWRHDFIFPEWTEKMCSFWCTGHIFPLKNPLQEDVIPTIKCCFTIITLVPGCTAWLCECF